MVKILAFDVSETLQTGADHNDGGLGQPMVDDQNQVIPGAYSVLVGGIATAMLLQEAQQRGIPIFLVTNNGTDGDPAVIERTLNFFKNYGINIPPKNYLGPKKEEGSKVPRLEEILQLTQIAKKDLLFFDDSGVNVKEAEDNGFNAIRVKSAKDLQQGIRDALTQAATNKLPPTTQTDKALSETTTNESPLTQAITVADLNAAIQRAQTKYEAHYKNSQQNARGSNGWFSWFRHTKTGQTNAKIFLERVKKNGATRPY